MFDDYDPATEKDFINAVLEELADYDFDDEFKYVLANELGTVLYFKFSCLEDCDFFKVLEVIDNELKKNKSFEIQNIINSINV